MFLSEEEKAVVAETIKRAEGLTSGEIVFAVTDASGRYRHATLQASLLGMVAATAVYLLLPVVHTIGMVLWIQLVSFATCYAISPWVSWRRRLISRGDMEKRAQEAAYREFYASGLHRTKESNGVLIYLSLFEHQVVVLADKGIHERMGTSHWGGVRDRIIRGFRQKRACEGICAAIEECGSALAKHFPRQPDDLNELPDQIIDRTRRSGTS